jgi:methionyl aminopeptidase
MIQTKTSEEIDTLKAGGNRLSQVMGKILETIDVGTQTGTLEEIARKEIKRLNGEAAFLDYQPAGANRPYPAALCVSVNDEIVHGISTEPSRELADGDVVTFDIGFEYKDLITDAAYTVGVGDISVENTQLIDTTREALAAGVHAAIAGNYVGDISAAIQTRVEEDDYAIYKELVGHGVGYSVHESPSIPNVGTAGSGAELQPGMVLAIEPMIGRGTANIEVMDDGYTYRTKDGSISAHFEHTIAITENTPEILTAWHFEDE